MRTAHLKTAIAFAALATLAAGSQAAITQAPDLPATVAITPLFSAFPPGPISSEVEGWTFEALGSARLDAGNWVADVVSADGTGFKLDPEAALRIDASNLAGKQRITWKNLSLQFGGPGVRPRLSGDGYVDGVLKYANGTFGQHEWYFDVHDDMAPALALAQALPEGQALLWASNGSELTSKAFYRGSLLADLHPYAFAKVSVSSVPEPASWLLMGLGLVGVTGLARRRSRA